MSQPTNNRSRILAFTLEYIQEYGGSPTVREIRKALGIPSTSTVDYHLTKLKESGALAHTPAKFRGLRIPGMRSVLDGQSVTVRTAGGELVTGELVAVEAVPA